MKLYGYEAGSDAEQPMTLREATIASDPEELRQIAAFLLRVASQMEAHGGRFGHAHLSDFLGDPTRKPDLIALWDAEREPCASPEP